MEERYILGQQALTPDGAVYQIIWDEPYNENITPDAIAQELPNRAPENTVAGSTCIYNTEDADGYPVEWLFAFDGTNWALDRVVRGGSAGGGGGGTSFPTFTNTGESWTCDMTYGEAKEVYDANKLGTRFESCPCKKSVFGDTGWDVMMYMLRSDIKGTTRPPMPSDLVACLVSGDVLYGNDNNFYVMDSV